MFFNEFIERASMHMTKFHCTHGDVFCACLMIFFTSSMFIGYIIYATQSHLALRSVKETHFRNHIGKLRNVFIVCGIIHIFSCVVSWFYPVNYLIIILTAFNLIQTIMLIHSKKSVLFIQQHLDGIHAVDQVEDALEFVKNLHEKEVESIRCTLEKLEQILIRER